MRDRRRRRPRAGAIYGYDLRGGHECGLVCHIACALLSTAERRFDVAPRRLDDARIGASGLSLGDSGGW